MQYFDKNGKEIKAGMKILMEDGSIEMVYDTEDQYGNPNLGINASNEEFLKLHPNWAREYYSLSMFKQSGIGRINDYNGDLVKFFRVLQRSEKLAYLIGRLYLSFNSEQLFKANKASGASYLLDRNCADLFFEGLIV